MPSLSGTIYAIRNLYAKPNPASNMLIANTVPLQMRMIRTTMTWDIGMKNAIRARFLLLASFPADSTINNRANNSPID